MMRSLNVALGDWKYGVDFGLRHSFVLVINR